MEIIDKQPIPFYEVTCPECRSVIRYKACEVNLCHITCPVCGFSTWADTVHPIMPEPPAEVTGDE
jgi:hypothetical protein